MIEEIIVIHGNGILGLLQLAQVKATNRKDIINMELLRDLWNFLKERKKWWLLPMIVMLLLIGFLIFSSGSAIAPFIYTLF
ncbi:MAG: hypothetical protein CSYNP_00020 [Syntrophus sp. SKADARSKE-3]|nr:hypothetical protein [Syntrophus sp. SKADARSKE-3]